MVHVYYNRNEPLPTTECMPVRASIETILYHTDSFLTPAVIFSYWGCGKSFMIYPRRTRQITVTTTIYPVSECDVRHSSGNIVLTSVIQYFVVKYEVVVSGSS